MYRHVKEIQLKHQEFQIFYGNRSFLNHPKIWDEGFVVAVVINRQFLNHLQRQNFIENAHVPKVIYFAVDKVVVITDEKEE